jgi:hypothetical protein
VRAAAPLWLRMNEKQVAWDARDVDDVKRGRGPLRGGGDGAGEGVGAGVGLSMSMPFPLGAPSMTLASSEL